MNKKIKQNTTKENNLISAKELMQDIKESEKEYEQGKSIQANSMVDLLKK